MKNLGGNIKSLRDFMRKDPGVSGDGQRIEQLGWLLFLKILDASDKELELLRDDFVSPIPERLRWCNWAADKEGMTGDELRNFIDQKLFPTLRTLDISTGNKRAMIVREIFEGTNNYMKNGTIIRQVLNSLNEIDFESSEDRHLFGDIYETILRELQTAGAYGEFYTPRALTEFMTEMVNPQLGEFVLDPACGTGGFLTCAINHLRLQGLDDVRDLVTLEKTIKGMEFKPLPFMLAVTNLFLHEIEVPNIEYTDSLNREYTSIGDKDRVDVILANPPFGAWVTDGVQDNFPMSYRTTESADLFLLLMVRYLHNGGRAAIILPDGSLTGDGVKARIRQHLLESCNLHTIVRLPNSVFKPYASVATNLLFFTKGKPTKEIWYWEHQLPEGVKAYSQTKPINKNEFKSLKKWWHKREENPQAWRVNFEELEKNGFNLDVKNPHISEVKRGYSSVELLGMLHDSFKESDQLLEVLKQGLKNG
ncbi:class I SAM-dependent DNA methyltransferase [Microcoleus sp. S28C3]|uniref:class I SAM-dependent DNA methyltransferase n=1 Tax=Microcoleus sp. S28C3 TaxID=3055414 RepID=UPI002FD2473B